MAALEGWRRAGLALRAIAFSLCERIIELPAKAAAPRAFAFAFTCSPSARTGLFARSEPLSVCI